MNPNHFLEFNGHKMYFTLIDREWWIALRPICDALQLDWKHLHKIIQTDKVLKPASCVHTMQLGKKQKRKYLCLPEFYIYGWLFQIRSDNPLLLEYKWQCYEILYQHFKGNITRRKAILQDKTILQNQKDQLKEQLTQNPEFLRYIKLEQELKKTNVSLKTMDKELLNQQITLF